MIKSKEEYEKSMKKNFLLSEPQALNEVEIVKLEYQHLSTPHEKTNLGNNYH